VSGGTFPDVVAGAGGVAGARDGVENELINDEAVEPWLTEGVVGVSGFELIRE
jgi:hypothetical protein